MTAWGLSRLQRSQSAEWLKGRQPWSGIDFKASFASPFMGKATA